jgi:hypothetical protein
MDKDACFGRKGSAASITTYTAAKTSTNCEDEITTQPLLLNQQQQPPPL